MFNVEGFIASLKYMGLGMLGIFVVTIIIISVMALLNKLPSDKENNNQ